MPFYCHQCQSSFDPPAAVGITPSVDPTNCSTCNSDFIEVLPEAELEEIEAEAGAGADPMLGLLAQLVISNAGGGGLPLRPRPAFFGAAPVDAPPPGADAGGARQFAETAAQRRRRRELEDAQMRADRGADASDPGESAEEERRRQDIMNLLGILMMAAGRGGNTLGQEPGLQQADGRQPRMVNPLFHLFGGVGDPRDYAFGQGGVDDIVTQLMEQARQSNAPPHLTEEQVAQLPHVTVKGSDLGEHPECAVCQDEFTNEGEGESVVKLSCNHHFHPPCIESWLKLNATCPVCRKAVPTTTAI